MVSGLMRPPCGGMISHTYTRFPGALTSMSSLLCTEFEWELHCFPEYPQISSWVAHGFPFGWLSVGKGAYYSPNPFDTGRASASINDLTRECLAPVDITAADAVAPTYRPATVADLHPTSSTRTPMIVPSTRSLMASTRKECSVYRILHARSRR